MPLQRISNTDIQTATTFVFSNTLFGLGSAGTPSLAFSGDTNTGIFSPGADTIAFAEGGVESMRIDSSGNVGIGTSSPSYKLQATGGNSTNNNDANVMVIDGTNHARLKINTTSSGGFRSSLILSSNSALSITTNEVAISTTGAQDMQFATAATERMRIDSSGNVGIGTSSPSLPFIVQKDNGSGYVAGFRANNTSPYLTIQTTGGITQLQGINSALTDVANIAFQPSGGNVGIGTSNPGAKLDVFNATATEVRSMSSTTSSYANFIVDVNNVVNQRLQMVGFGSTAADNLLGIARANNGFIAKSGGLLGVGTRDANALVFGTNEAERMRIDASGNVGIGTSSPAVSLDVGSKTDAIAIPQGTTAQRPASPANGHTRYNTSLGRMEYYVNGVWGILDFDATSNQYLITHTVVGGGGGGGMGSTSGGYPGGGGGAGGVNQGTFLATVGTVYTITVGGGGSGGTTSLAYAGTGNASTITVSGLTLITGYGGGRGGNNCSVLDAWGAAAGGSGGGGGGLQNSITGNNVFGSYGGAGTTGQGNAGGYGMFYGTPAFIGGGGGGGAGSPGGSALVGNGPVGGAANGGNGVRSIINSVIYGGGGGGGYGQYGGAGGGSGGDSIGGNGGGSTIAATAAVTNRGSGGGGGGGSSVGLPNGGSGSSGVVILMVPTSRYTGTTTGSPTISTSGNNTIMVFTSSGTYTA